MLSDVYNIQQVGFWSIIVTTNNLNEQQRLQCSAESCFPEPAVAAYNTNNIECDVYLGKAAW